jgi:hypothetical protein
MTRQEITGKKFGAGHTSEVLTDPYLGARAVRQRYGNCSEMWLYRRLRDGSGFPQPDLEVSGRHFWKLSKLVAWEKQRALAPA